MKMTDELLKLPLYREDLIFRRIVDDYRNPDVAFAFTSHQHVFNMGAVLAFVASLSEEIARAEERIVDLENALEECREQKNGGER